MPGMMALSIDVAPLKDAALYELKIDGTRMTFDGNNIFSDRKINRNERYPHLINELRKLNIRCRGEVALEGGNILQLNKKINWHKAKYYIFDLYEVDGQSTNDLNIVQKRDLIDDIVNRHGSEYISSHKNFNTF